MTGRVIGFDLSMVATGLAMPDGSTYTIVPRKKGDLRLVEFEDQIIYYLEAAYRAPAYPELAVIESIPTAGKGFNVAIILGMIHGIARKNLAARRIPFAYIDNKILKKYATGYGGADKQLVIDSAFEAGGQPANDNEADAFWLRAAGMHRLGQPVDASSAMAADLIIGPMSRVKWPELGGSTPSRAT